jgi:aryl-alcohol dehydrogenase-like predicted oxidoreductase
VDEVDDDRDLDASCPRLGTDAVDLVVVAVLCG